jgi:hypothetical protein
MTWDSELSNFDSVRSFEVKGLWRIGPKAGIYFEI